MFNDPRVRLVARAVLAGLVVFAQALQSANDPFAKSALVGAVTAAVWAVVEYVTPLNKTVGK